MWTGQEHYCSLLICGGLQHGTSTGGHADPRARHDGNGMENFQVDSHEKVKIGNPGALTLMMSSRRESREIYVQLPEKLK
jgi:hypothetical protein